MKKFFETLKDDFLNKKFVPLKIVYFLATGAISTISPFQTLHARVLGITGTELGFIYAILPLAGIIGPSFVGLLADKLGNFRLLVSFALILGGLTALLFIVIPVGRIEKKLPEQLPVTVECSANSPGTVKPQLSCTLDAKHSESFINISKCSVNCSEINADSNSLNNAIQGWCNDISDCERAEDSGNVSLNLRNKEKIDHKSKDNETYYHFNNFSVLISLDKNKNFINVSEPFCPEWRPERELFLDSGEDNSATINWTRSAMPDECYLGCRAFALSKEICKNKRVMEEKNIVVTIIGYTIVRFLYTTIVASSFVLFESAVIAIMDENDGQLGLQKMYGNIGQIVLTPISGKLIDHFSALKGKPDYNPSFYLFCGIQFLCAAFFLRINLNFKKPSNNVLKDFKKLISQPVVLTFLIFAIIVGICYGFVETFLFWLLEDLGADKRLMGLTVTIGAIFGIPLLMVSKILMEKLGYVTTLTLCCVIYVIRFVGYSLIINPWAVMPFEALESITTSLFVVVLYSYAARLSGPSTMASLQGLIFGTYFGVGKGLGSLIGGVMLERLGSRLTFRILAALAGGVSVVYFLIDRFFFKKYKETRVSVLKNPKQVAEFNVNDISNNNRTSHNNMYKKSEFNGRENKAFNNGP